MTFAKTLAQRRERREAEKAANMEALCTPSRAISRGTYAGSTAGPVPKTQEQRNPHLLAMANGMPCLLLVPGVCSHRIDTVVACHSNQGAHGKAGARKADDQFTVWGCASCHAWLDQGSAPAAYKSLVFAGGMNRQRLAWEQIARSPNESDADRRAAQWALDRLAHKEEA
jgi:hypothetical protein